MRREVKLGSSHRGTLVFGWQPLAYVWWARVFLLVHRVFLWAVVLGRRVLPLEMSLKILVFPSNGGKQELWQRWGLGYTLDLGQDAGFHRVMSRQNKKTGNGLPFGMKSVTQTLQWGTDQASDGTEPWACLQKQEEGVTWNIQFSILKAEQWWYALKSSPESPQGASFARTSKTKPQGVTASLGQPEPVSCRQIFIKPKETSAEKNGSGSLGSHMPVLSPSPWAASRLWGACSPGWEPFREIPWREPSWREPQMDLLF